MMKTRLVFFLLFLFQYCTAQITPVIPSFTIPDTVCVNTPVNIVNTTTGAATNYWNFCVAGLNTIPTGLNLGNPGNYLSQPVFVDLVEDNGKFYGFVINHVPGGIVRLDFGASLLNIPVPVFIGNPGGVMNINFGNEGIQVVKNEGKWYGIIVGGSPASQSVPKIVKISFGANIENTTPTGLDWGNLGNMLEPIDFHLFQENSTWYGLTVNSESSTITRFNFTNSFENTPTGINIGNIGNLNYPTGVYAINDNGFWRIFVTNRDGGSSLTRLDFGSSLLNPPAGLNLGNPANVLQSPRDFTIVKLCGEIIGFAVNGATNNIARLNFNENLALTPTGSAIPNTGNLNLPHSISKFFRDGNDIYTLVTNVNNNTITRLQLAGCTNASVTSSQLQNPAPVTYNTPGTYHINLSVDDGLATQSAYCREVVVVPALIHTPLQKIVSCTDSIKVGTGVKQVSYLWNTGATTDSIYVKGNAVSWVQTSRFGCSNRDSFAVSAQNISVKTNNDTAVCALKPVQLNTIAASGASSYQWSPATGLSNISIANPVATPSATTQYIVTGTAANGCTGKDTVLIAVSPKPVIQRTADTTICHNSALQLNASGGNQYCWLPNASLSNTAISNPIATPSLTTTYYVTVTNSGNCTSMDSVRVAIKSIPVFSVSPDTSTCAGTTIRLTASGGTSYAWDPVAGLNNASVASPVASPAASAVYTVKISERTCKDSVRLTTTVTVLPLPVVQATSSNDIDCTRPASQLTASGASRYLWQPGTGLNDSAIASPLSSPAFNTVYTVKGTAANGCSNYDTVSVLITHAGDLLVNMPNAFTPNGDGKNDCFGVSRYAGLLQHTELSVYDRFGVRLFYTTNPLNCWDGRYKGTLQDAGGFVYILKAETFCGTVFKKGVVMLLK